MRVGGRPLDQHLVELGEVLVVGLGVRGHASEGELARVVEEAVDVELALALVEEGLEHEGLALEGLNEEDDEEVEHDEVEEDLAADPGDPDQQQCHEALEALALLARHLQPVAVTGQSRVANRGPVGVDDIGEDLVDAVVLRGARLDAQDLEVDAEVDQPEQEEAEEDLEVGEAGLEVEDDLGEGLEDAEELASVVDGDAEEDAGEEAEDQVAVEVLLALPGDQH
mmetsp:Transcript_8788/g.14918  ORF Transcript_8788/g.14918 Transcript_8788/m.14918 type:complete len:225 (+) Transcript_8788:310-984(+)